MILAYSFLSLIVNFCSFLSSVIIIYSAIFLASDLKSLPKSSPFSPKRLSSSVKFSLENTPYFVNFLKVPIMFFISSSDSYCFYRSPSIQALSGIVFTSPPLPSFIAGVKLMRLFSC